MYLHCVSLSHFLFAIVFWRLSLNGKEVLVEGVYIYVYIVRSRITRKSRHVIRVINPCSIHLKPKRTTTFHFPARYSTPAFLPWKNRRNSKQKERKVRNTSTSFSVVDDDATTLSIILLRRRNTTL